MTVQIETKDIPKEISLADVDGDGDWDTRLIFTEYEDDNFIIEGFQDYDEDSVFTLVIHRSEMQKFASRLFSLMDY